MALSDIFSSSSTSQAPTDQAGQAQQSVYNISTAGGGKKSNTDVDIHIRPTDHQAVENAAAIAIASAEGNVAVSNEALELAGDISEQANDIVLSSIENQQETLEDFADLQQANLENVLAFGGEAQQASYDFASATVGNVAGLLSAGQDIAASAIASNESIVNTALGIVNSNVGVVERTANSAIDALTLGQAEALEAITQQAEDSLVYAGGAMQQLSGGYTTALQEIQEAAESEASQGIENVVGLTQNVILGLVAVLGATLFLARR